MTPDPGRTAPDLAAAPVPDPLPVFAEREVRVADGVTLRVRQLPAGSGRPFLLVHGMASNARVWDEVAAVLAAAGHPVHAVDLRGHGRSDAPDGGYDTATAAADLRTVAGALGLTGAVLAGHSWGGNVALRLAAGGPGPAAAVALVDGGWLDLTTAVSTWDECLQVAAALRGPVLGTTRRAMRDYLRMVHPAWSPAALDAALADLREEPDGTMTPRTSEEQFLAIVGSLWEDPPSRDYPAVGVPVLLLPAVPAGVPQWEVLVRRWVAAAEAGLPDATTRWYLGAEHHLQAERPGEVADDLLRLARTAG